MKKWHLTIDVAKCENCNNCFLACKDEHCCNDWPGYTRAQPLRGQRWMNILRKERGAFPAIDVAYLPKPCMHCDAAPCIRVAQGGAVYKRPDGIVLIDPEKSVGQKALVAACPYGAIWWNAEENLPQKCTLCAHLLDSGWKTPRCVQACPTGALSIHWAERGRLVQLKKDPAWSTLGGAGNPTHPRVVYKNLFRFTDSFIAGSVATRRNGIEECVADLSVNLVGEGQVLDYTTTDSFGDFKFDGLAAHSGTYGIEIDAGGEEKPLVEVSLGGSLSIGTIWI